MRFSSFISCLALGTGSLLAGEVVQPTEIPGEWKISPPPFPPLEQILAMPADHLPVYGLYAWCGEYTGFRDGIREVGWKSVRIGGPMEDAAMQAMAEDGVEVMKTVQIGLMAGEPRLRRDKFDSDEAFIAAYQQSVTAFLDRYGPGGAFFKEHPVAPNRPIRLVEIWNEPNFQYMIPDRQPRAEVEKERETLYAKVLPAMYEMVKRKSPEVQVVGFGAGGAAAGDIRFIKNVHANNPAVAKSYDILSTHSYTTPAGPDMDSVRKWGSYSVAGGLDQIRKDLATYGNQDKPIWYTEVGWPISQNDGGQFADKGSKELVTPLLQAAYVCRLYAIAMRLGVRRVHIMFCSDSDGFNGGFFVRKDKSWRPSAHAVKNMIKLMPNPKLTAALSDGVDGYFAYEFQADHRDASSPRLVMAWNAAGHKEVKIPVKAATAVVTDLLGNAKEMKAANGAVTVTVGPCPVYVGSK